MNKKIFELKDISLARAFLYGFAILWIMFFHSNFVCTNPVLSWIKTHGNCGVDIFFLLSGISLYFSYTKNRDPKRFYKNRFKRVLPYFIFLYGGYFIVSLIVSSICHAGGV